MSRVASPLPFRGEGGAPSRAEGEGPATHAVAARRPPLPTLSPEGERARLANAAESLIGTPFRLHGRCRERGVDCLGLVLVAMGEIGRPVRLRLRYGLRNLEPERFLRLAESAGIVEAADLRLEQGDVLALEPGPAQLHLAVVAPGGAVHAHAGLRRVVRTPFPLAWPIVGHWRLEMLPPQTDG